jgi:hypothetical protein
MKKIQHKINKTILRSERLQPREFIDATTCAPAVGRHHHFIDHCRAGSGASSGRRCDAVRQSRPGASDVVLVFRSGLAASQPSPSSWPWGRRALKQFGGMAQKKNRLSNSVKFPDQPFGASTPPSWLAVSSIWTSPIGTGALWTAGFPARKSRPAAKRIASSCIITRSPGSVRLSALSIRRLK